VANDWVAIVWENTVIDQVYCPPPPTSPTFTHPNVPAGVPGTLRATALVCGPDGSVTIQNQGAADLSLKGFSLLSSGGTSGDEVFLLNGVLKPGQTMVIDGSLAGWTGKPGTEAIGDTETDDVRIAWGTTIVDTARCGSSQPPVFLHYPLPTFAPDQEGAIELDVIVNFNERGSAQVVSGWNLVSIPGSGSIAVSDALAGSAGMVQAIYSWDAESTTWQRYVPGVVGGNTLDTLESGKVYWVLAKGAFTLTVPH
jgi:hypothetical protein